MYVYPVGMFRPGKLAIEYDYYYYYCEPVQALGHDVRRSRDGRGMGRDVNVLNDV